jgi:hypothetical protein
MSSTWKDPPEYSQIFSHLFHKFLPFFLFHPQRGGATKNDPSQKKRGGTNIKIYLNGGERPVQREHPHLLKDTNQGPLVAGEDEAGGDIGQEVHVGRLVERRAGEKGAEVARDHTRRPEAANDLLRLSRAQELGEDK